MDERATSDSALDDDERNCEPAHARDSRNRAPVMGTEPPAVKTLWTTGLVVAVAAIAATVVRSSEMIRPDVMTMFAVGAGVLIAFIFHGRSWIGLCPLLMCKAVALLGACYLAYVLQYGWPSLPVAWDLAWCLFLVLWLFAAETAGVVGFRFIRRRRLATVHGFEAFFGTMHAMRVYRGWRSEGWRCPA